MAEESGGFSVGRALLLMAILSQAYAQYKQPQGAIVLPHPYRMTAAFAGKAYAGEPAALAFLAESERDAVLAFRGTVRTDEWLSDALFRQIACPFARGLGRTHAGFSDIYMSMRAKIAEAIGTIPPAKPLFIAGHSLGGALAALAAADLASGERRTVVYTFGAPRAGDPRFACRYRRLVPESYRVVNPNDIVTKLPPPVCWLPATNDFYFYRHVPARIRVEFRPGPKTSNHSLLGYFRALASRAPALAATLGAAFKTEED
jgi:triacylglycerol lipase